ncbi:YALIA101S03e22056g1_1 [Yarrowia lipolytica]|nr:Histone-lysine N-methyltransferase SET9 [Yarrowia lipolytica]SEI33590.1 YALIA101S03e22056g1_1 [Yarrowia lipolytica]
MITVTPGELATIDDALTDLLLERVFYWAEVRKASVHYKPLRGISDRHIHDLVRSIAACETGAAANLAVKKATNAFLELKEVRGYRGRLSPLAYEEFQRHTVRYLTIYKASCGFEINVSMRYKCRSNRGESCVISRVRYNRGDEIVGLSGCLAKMTKDEELALANDFSVLHSSRRGGNCLMLGPARFVNHDCSANARFVPVPSGMVIQAVKPINVGDEITVKYAENYFGRRNKECLCQTCEENSRGLYGSPQESSEEESDDDMDELTKIELQRRKKRQEQREGGTPELREGGRGSSESSRETSEEAIEISTSKNWPLIPKIESHTADSTPLPVPVGEVSEATVTEVSTVVPAQEAIPVNESTTALSQSSNEFQDPTIDPILNGASAEIRFPSLPSPDTTTSPESQVPPFIQPKSARRNHHYLGMHNTDERVRFNDRLSVLDERGGSEDMESCLVSGSESRDDSTAMSRDEESSRDDGDVSRSKRSKRHVRAQRKNSGSWSFSQEDLSFDRLCKAAREQAYDPSRYALTGVYGFSVSGATQTCVSCCSVYNLTDGPKTLGHFCPRCHRHAAIHSFAWPYTNHKHALPLCLLMMRPPKKLEDEDWGLSKPQVAQQFGAKNRKIFEEDGSLVQKKRKSLAWSWEYTKEEPAQEITSMRIEDMSPKELKKWSQAGRQTRSGRVSMLPEKPKRSRKSAPEPVEMRDNVAQLSREERAWKRARRGAVGHEKVEVNTPTVETPSTGTPKVKKLHWKQKLAMERRQKEAEAAEVAETRVADGVDAFTPSPAGSTPTPRGRGRPRKSSREEEIPPEKTPEAKRPSPAATKTPSMSPKVKKEPLSMSFSMSPTSRSGRVRNPTEKALQLMEQGEYVI